MTRRVEEIESAFDALEKRRVLVGVPASSSARDDGAEINNAALLYIHEHGAPEINLPARPVMKIGLNNAREQIKRQLAAAAREALAGRKGGVTARLQAVGLIAQASIKEVFATSQDLAPLALSTLRSKARKSVPGAADELASRLAGNPPTDAVQPLVGPTHSLENSIQYVVK